VKVLTPLTFANCRTEGILVPTRSSRRFTIPEIAATIWSTRLPRRWRSIASTGQAAVSLPAQDLTQLFPNHAIEPAPSGATLATVQVMLPVRLDHFAGCVYVPPLSC
jgi:hypothetical protein